MLSQALYIKVMHFKLIILDYQDRPTSVIYTYRFNMLNSALNVTLSDHSTTSCGFRL